MEVHQASAAAYGWTKLAVQGKGAELLLEGRVLGPTTIWLNGKLAATVQEAGLFQQSVSVAGGSYDLLVHSMSGSTGWGFELNAISRRAASFV